MKALLFLLFAFIQSNSDQRVIDVYAKNKTDKLYLEQLEILNSDPKGLKDRDIVVKEHLGSPSFKITLRGKDGGQKLNSKSVLTLKKLFDTIDSMPMRKSEMSRKSY
jgi:hypothetical protein